MKYFPEPIFVKDLCPNMDNVCLFGKITRLDTTPGDNASFRAGISLEDSDGGIVDITFWDSLGFEVIKSSEGQVMFIQNIFVKHTQANRWIGNCSLSSGGKIFNISQLEGFLNSPILYSHTYFKDVCPQSLCTFVCKASIFDFKLKEPSTYFVHTDCKRPLKHKEGRPFCDACSKYSTQLDADRDYHIIWTLDDASGAQIEAKGTFAVNKKIMQMTAQDFSKLNHQQQVAKLEQVKLSWWLLSISQNLQRGINVKYRIDQLTSAKSCLKAEIQKLMSLLNKK